MPRKGLIGLLGSGVGMAAEYHEHRKQQKLSRENSQQDEVAVAGPSSRPHADRAAASSSSDLPPAYSDVTNEGSGRSLASGGKATDDKKAAMAQYDDGDDSSSDSDDLSSIEDDEEDWELDEVIERDDPPSYEDSQQPLIPVDDLVQQVTTKNRTALAAAPGFERTPIPCPVIIPQRRPRKKGRGFVHAYAPILGECSGIDQETFLTFIENFYKSSQASPIFPVIEVAAAIAGFAPSVIAMAVTTAVQVAARTGAEIQSRQRTNAFLDKMNEELFKPAGLYAMIVKYKSEQEVRESSNSLLARFGVSGSAVDFNTNQSIAKYSRTTSEQSESRSISDRIKGLRLASGQTKGAIQIPASAPLIFPDVDKAIAKDGPETFKDKAKDAQSFIASYMDRKAQRQYAQDDPTSSLAIPEDQRTFKSKLADPNHPMYNGGIIGFVSGGALTRDRGSMGPRQERRFQKDERRMLRYEQRMASGRRMTPKRQRRYDRIVADEEFYGRGRGMDGYGGQPGGYGYGAGGRGRGGLVGGLLGAVADRDKSREFEDSYGNQPAPHAGYGGDEKYARRSFDDRSGGPASHAAYGGRQSSYGAESAGYGGLTRDPRRRRRQGGGPLGAVKRVMREDVLYLMIVNMPSEAELAEAQEALARAKNGN